MAMTNLHVLWLIVIDVVKLEVKSIFDVYNRQSQHVNEEHVTTDRTCSTCMELFYTRIYKKYNPPSRICVYVYQLYSVLM